MADLAEPAPGRGRYDRSQSRQVRQTEQRERLVRWIAEAYRARGERLTVNDVVSAAGVGRNTFYEYFDGLEHALGYASQAYSKQIYEQLVSDLEQARTTIAKLRFLTHAWLAQAHSAPAAMSLLLRPPAPDADSPLCVAETLFTMLLRRALCAHPRLATRPDTSRELCAAFAATGSCRVVLHLGEPTLAPADALAESLETLLTQAFR